MTITVNHSTPADGTFSATGATAWNASHTLSGVLPVANGGTNTTTSTGTGSVVLNSNPSFATDITVNGLTAGRGAGSVSTNTALGVDALSTTSNGAGSLTILPGSSGTTGDYTNIQLEYVSGTPATTYPIVDVSVDSEIYNVTIKNAGSGFVNTTTIMKVPDGEPFSGQFQVASLTSRSNTIGIGLNAGIDNPVGNNNIYIGNGVVGTPGANREIIIGATAGLGTNTIKIGESYQTVTFSNLTAGNTAVTALTTSQIIPPSTDLTIGVFGQPLNMFLAAGTDITLDSPINNIGIDSVTGSPKTVNIGTSATAGGNVAVNIGKAVGTSTTTINGAVTLSATTQAIDIGTSQTSGTVIVGGTGATGTISLGRSTGAQTVNIATGVTAASTTKAVNIGTAGNATSTTNIAIGSATGTSTTTVNGYFKPPALASAPTYVKGAVYFDTTLNKLRVGGATTWETITSV